MLAEVFVLVHDECPDPPVDLQPARPVGEHEAAADIETGTDLGLAAVLPNADLDARLERPAA